MYLYIIKLQKMKKAIFGLSKTLMIINDHFVMTRQMGDFVQEAIKYDLITLVGFTSVKKFAKYTEFLNLNGFIEVKENWKRFGQYAPGSVDFSIEFSKTIKQ